MGGGKSYIRKKYYLCVLKSIHYENYQLIAFALASVPYVFVCTEIHRKRLCYGCIVVRNYDFGNCL